MKVYLLPVDSSSDRRLFYAEATAEEDRAEAPPAAGIRGRIEARLRRLKAAWERSRSGPVRWSRGVWDWLQRRTHPDEPLLSRLRSAATIELGHPPSMTAEEAGAAWSTFLARGRRRHWPWFVVNVAVSPLTLLLAPLPGPNLIGYWFAYRAVHHWLILVGLRRARAGAVATRFHPADALETAGEADGYDRLSALGCDPVAVAEFLERQGVVAEGRAPGAAPSDRE